MNTDELFIDADKLPNPLPKSQLYELLDKVEQGNEDAAKIIIEHNIRLVLYLVSNKFKSIEYDKKDLVSIGNIGLIKAVKTFDKSKKVKFSTYATRCINNEILIFIKKVKKDQKIDSLDKTITHGKEGKELKIKDIISDEINIVKDYEKNINYKIIQEIIKELPERNREIIMLYFGFYNNKTYTQKEIADIMSVSQPYISKLIPKIVKRIKIQLQENDVIETSERTNKQTKNQAINIQSKKKAKSVNKDSVVIEKSSIDIEERHFEKMKRKKLQTIYEYLKEYTREEIDEMLSKLTDEEIHLIELRYGDDLDNPVTSSTWGKEETRKFYGSLIPKMKRSLYNQSKKEKKYTKKVQNISNTNNQFSILSQEESNIEEVNQPELISQKVENSKAILSQTTSKIEKDDYLKILELMRTPSFGEMLKSLTPKEAVIICLKLGYVDGKYFTTESIANFLEIETNEVIETTKNILLVYKENINKFIDKAVEVTTESSLVKKKNK